MKERTTFMLFLIIVILVNLGVNLYLFSRTRAIFPENIVIWRALAVFFWIVAFSYVIGRFAERVGPVWLAEPFIKTGSWWLGAMVYLTLLFLLADIFRGLIGLFRETAFLRFSWGSSSGQVVVLFIYLLSAVILVAGYINARSPVVNQIAVRISKPVPGGKLKAVLVSDIHLGMMISNGRLDRMVNMVNREEADVVLLGGDVFDEDLGPVIKNNMGDLLKNLQAKHGVFAVLGNHEFYGNAPAAHKYLEDHRITVLRDSAVTLSNGVTIIGREDITSERMYGKPRKTIGALLEGIDTAKPVLMLDHQPFKLSEVASHKIDLQVSGHTHHGQMWPFNFITGSIYEISRGYGKIKNTHFYVSSGYGTWGPPIRTNSRPEIAVLHITGE